MKYSKRYYVKMFIKVAGFLKKQYEDIAELFRFEVPSGKNQYKFNTVLDSCRKSQYCLAALLILPFLFWESFWKLINGATLRDGVALITMEFSAWTILGYVLGLKRLPANYISLAIIKVFIVLDKTFKPKVQDFRVKVLEESPFGSQWSVVTHNPEGGTTQMMPYQLRNMCLVAVWIGSVWGIGKYTKIDMSRQENCALISTTAITSTAAILLMTTLSFDAFPRVVEFHRRCCELWVLTAVCVLAFIMLFLFQRLIRIIRGEIKPRESNRMWWESIIFILSLYLMLMYIPVIHNGFSTRRVFEVKTEILVTTVLPMQFTNILESSSALGHNIFESTTKIYSKLLRGAAYP
ncbi:hypothetical protein Ocin01_16120 [Orchesella cincta]|uniref:Uncharacterized protein n=1 Tax=Orchesella cincta TaxID=48709 RepID=A0A1D2MCC2_ORCCI|nr:hypothetical protein Ocin01_16120 [Orchesella cincta]